MSLASRNLLLICVAIFICIKGLGGAFHSPLAALGWIQIRSPIIGTIIGILIIAACWTFRPKLWSPIKAGLPTSKQKRIFLLLFSLLVGLAVFNRVQAIHRLPIDVNRADMLPAVQSQIDDFLRGSDPYAPLLVEGKEIPRAYLPGIWLGYLPLSALGIDLRYLNIFAHFVLYLLLLDCFLRKGQYFGWSFPASAALFLFMLGMHVYSKEAVREVVDVQTAPFWLSYSILLWATLRRKTGIGNIALAFMVTCRQPAILLALPYLVWEFKNNRSQALHTLLWIFAGCTVLILPFFAANPNGFLGATLWHLKLLTMADFEGMARFYGLGAALNYFQIERLQLPLQLVGILTACWLACCRKESEPLAALALGGIAYTWMMLLVPVTFPYVFAEPLILLFFLLQALTSREALDFQALRRVR